MAFVLFAQADTFAKAAAIVTLTLIVWAIARFRWFANGAETADEGKLSGVMVAVSAVVVAVAILAAILGPHPA